MIEVVLNGNKRTRLSLYSEVKEGGEFSDQVCRLSLFFLIVWEVSSFRYVEFNNDLFSWNIRAIYTWSSMMFLRDIEDYLIGQVETFRGLINDTIRPTHPVWGVVNRIRLYFHTRGPTRTEGHVHRYKDSSLGSKQPESSQTRRRRRPGHTFPHEP